TAEEFDNLTLKVADILGLEATVDADDATESDGPSYGVSEAVEAASQDLPQPLIAYIEDAARDLGAECFRLADVVLNYSREEIDAIAREVFQKALSNLAEVIDQLGVDVVLLTGRPSRLPAVRAVLEEMLVVPPHRLISMHNYKAGRWYPFRDPLTQRVGDPKSTVAVGGMLIALSESRMPNFKVATKAFRMRSTARFIGEMDSSEQIMDERLLFSNVDLDDRKSESEMVATLKMYTPVYIGSRQLPMERWTTTPLFRMDFANNSAQSRAPLSVSLERTEFEGDTDQMTSDTALRREAMREAVSIVEVEDNEGTGMKTSEVQLLLQTLGFEDEYWIDTGLFRL
ncbi:MAG: virulence factor SrfB, partial [Paracoccaceae bacterium]